MRDVNQWYAEFDSWSAMVSCIGAHLSLSIDDSRTRNRACRCSADLARKAPAASTNKSSKDRPTAAPPTAIPSPIELLNLIRTTLLALNQANLTGNYTVLRDLGAPDFQRSNNASVLADTFRDLRVRRIDLSPVATINPKLVREPSIDAKGLLRLTGFFLHARNRYRSCLSVG